MNGLSHCVDTIYKSQRFGSYLFVKSSSSKVTLRVLSC